MVYEYKIRGSVRDEPAAADARRTVAVHDVAEARDVEGYA